MEFVLIFIVAVFFWIHGAYSGWKAREEHARKVTEELLKNIKVEEEEEDNLVQITIEEHQGILYVYDKENNSFMAQGKTREELEDNLSSRFPGKRFAASSEDLEKASISL
jgi:hypothetical protein